jgi:phospholipid/cholesterol/gamma-HCH transport system ATP-binding protein
LSERELTPIRKKFGVLFQGAALFDSMTVFENVAFPLREERKLDEPEITKRVEQALTIVDLLNAKDKKPAELSGGMRKRAALARAMVLDPEIIFCDEPSAGLDPITAAGLDELMLNLKQHFRITFLVVTHELRSIEKIADKALVLNDGRLHYFGEYRRLETLNDPFIDTFFLKDVDHDH